MVLLDRQTCAIQIPFQRDTWCLQLSPGASKSLRKIRPAKKPWLSEINSTTLWACLLHSSSLDWSKKFWVSSTILLCPLPHSASSPFFPSYKCIYIPTFIHPLPENSTKNSYIWKNLKASFTFHTEAVFYGASNYHCHSVVSRGNADLAIWLIWFLIPFLTLISNLGLENILNWYTYLQNTTIFTAKNGCREYILKNVC